METLENLALMEWLLAQNKHWLNLVDDEINKTENTRYIRILYQTETEAPFSVGKLNIIEFIPILCHYWEL